MHAVVKTRRGPGGSVAMVETPEIGDGYVLAKVEAATICGTDIHIWKWNRWAEQRIKKIPLILGHEFAGQIVEVGHDVSTLKKGDMISAETHIVDNICYQCRTDRRHVCRNTKILGVDRDGVFAEYVALPEENAWKNDPSLEPEIASLQEPLGNAVHAALPKDSVDDIAGNTVAVLGCGPIGLMAIAVVKELGARQVYATAGGGNMVRMQLASTMGADLVLNARKEGERIVSKILATTDGKGVDVSLEMSGNPLAVKQAFDILAPGGRVSLLGVLDKTVELDLNNAIIFKAAQVYGITGRRMFQTWYQVKGLLSKPTLKKKINQLITHRVPISDIAKAMDLIINKQAAKVALKLTWQ